MPAPIGVTAWIVDRAHRRDAGIVDEDVETARDLGEIGDLGDDRGAAANVQRDGDRQTPNDTIFPAASPAPS